MPQDLENLLRRAQDKLKPDKPRRFIEIGDGPTPLQAFTYGIMAGMIMPPAVCGVLFWWMGIGLQLVKR